MWYRYFDLARLAEIRDELNQAIQYAETLRLHELLQLSYEANEVRLLFERLPISRHLCNMKALFFRKTPHLNSAIIQAKCQEPSIRRESPICKIVVQSFDKLPRGKVPKFNSVTVAAHQ